MVFRRIGIVIGIVILLAGFAYNGATALEPALSKSEVSAVRDASRDVAPIMQEHQAEFERLGYHQGKRAGHGADPCEVPPDARSGPGFQKMLDVAKSHGFSTGDQYCRSSFRVMAACGAMRAQKEDPNWRETLSQRGPAAEQARAQMEQMRRQVEANTNLSAEQKAQMLEKMSELTKGLAGANNSPMVSLMEKVSPQDMQIAAPACAELERIYLQGTTQRG